MDPERRAIDADTARTLWNLVEELSPRQRTLLRALFTAPSPSLHLKSPAPPESRPARSGPRGRGPLAKLRCCLEQRQPTAWMPRKNDVLPADTQARIGRVWAQP